MRGKRKRGHGDPIAPLTKGSGGSWRPGHKGRQEAAVAAPGGGAAWLGRGLGAAVRFVGVESAMGRPIYRPARQGEGEAWWWPAGGSSAAINGVGAVWTSRSGAVALR